MRTWTLMTAATLLTLTGCDEATPTSAAGPVIVAGPETPSTPTSEDPVEPDTTPMNEDPAEPAFNIDDTSTWPQGETTIEDGDLVIVLQRGSEAGAPEVCKKRVYAKGDMKNWIEQWADVNCEGKSWDGCSFRTFELDENGNLWSYLEDDWNCNGMGVEMQDRCEVRQEDLAGNHLFSMFVTYCTDAKAENPGVMSDCEGQAWSKYGATMSYEDFDCDGVLEICGYSEYDDNGYKIFMGTGFDCEDPYDVDICTMMEYDVHGKQSTTYHGECPSE